MSQVLLIDPNRELCETISSILETHGLSCHFTNELPQLIPLLKENSYDLILCDPFFPGTKGFEILERIDALTNAPIVMISSRLTEEDQEGVSEWHVADTLQKPFEMSELLSVVEVLLTVEKEGPQVSASSESDFCPIPIQKIQCSHLNLFDIFIKLGGEKYVCVARAHSDKIWERIDHYRKKGIKSLYVHCEDYARYFGFSQDPKQPALTAEDRNEVTKMMHYTHGVIVQSVCLQSHAAPEWNYARDLFESHIELTLQYRELRTGVRKLQGAASKVFLDAVRTGVYGLLVSQKMDKYTPKEQFDISCASLMRSIGKSDLDQSLQKKSISEMNQEELEEFYRYITISLDYIRLLDTLPQSTKKVTMKALRLIAGENPKLESDGGDLELAKTIAALSEFMDHLPNKPSEHTIRKTLDELRDPYSDWIRWPLEQIVIG